MMASRDKIKTKSLTTADLVDLRERLEKECKDDNICFPPKKNSIEEWLQNKLKFKFNR